MTKFLVVMFLVVSFSKIVFGEEPPIKNLSRLEEFREAFQKDTGKVRIVTLLSPT
jgi:hypothetical protein